MGLHPNLEYVAWDEQSKLQSQAFGEEISSLMFAVEKHLPASRERSLALTHLEESFMWIGKALRNEQRNRNQAKENGHG